MTTFACLYRTGGDYDFGHVRALRLMVGDYSRLGIRFACLSDRVHPDLLPLEKAYPGKWSMAELFKLTGPVIVTGLDTVIVGDIDPLIRLAETCTEDDFWMIRSFANQRKHASGIMIWNGDWSWLWKEYKYKKVRETYKLEQRYTTDKLHSRGVRIKTIQNEISGIYSYKKHCRGGLPEDARIVLFHGNPRPHKVKSGWVPKRYPYDAERSF